MAEMRKLLGLMRPWTGWIALGVFLSLITALANVTLMAISGWFIAAMALAGLAGVTMNYFTPAAIIRAMAITRTVGRYAERLVTHEATLRLVAELRRWFYDRMEPLAPAGLQGMKSGDIFSRIGADITTLENFYLRVLVPALVAVIAVPIFCIFAGYFSTGLAVALIIFYFLGGILTPWLIHHFGREAASKQVLEAADMRASLVEGQQALREMLVYGREEDYRQLIDEQSGRLCTSQLRLAKLQAASQSALTLAASLAMFAALWFIIPKVSDGTFEGPILPMLMLFAMASFEVIVPLPVAIRAFIETQVAAKRLFGLTDQPPKGVSARGPEAIDGKPSATPTLALKDVSLAYEDGGKSAFDHISLVVEPGERVAIVGPSGVGKSSIINALVGFWPLTGGEILIDGQPHSRFTAESLRAHFAVAPQKPHLFNSTLKGNLLVANPDATEAMLHKVLDQVQLSDFVASEPEGIETFVGEAGGTLSGGQIRRLSIARALLSPAPILVLDEPGEGLDPQMEREILNRILDEETGRTILLITHNSAALERMDKRLELSDSH
ncbi:thiol reductant ABC exporter subunit CydC [uncultured Cohaesibacter sp.]|uniref:thiol reductant ABC exporter subunit CydC n=1 Tax=uncultured Cohaesibacter sp. TaxID=1002546 RepID=UPI0029C883E0|nr:thiol reductant ABC exporter subunit CydC [uncultured Cohaesibacter sp.]